MNIIKLMGHDVVDLRALAVARWPEWVAAAPQLGCVGSPDELDTWWRLPDARDVVNGVLLALARLAAFDGEDDRDAAAVLAWMLEPAAAGVARRFGNGLLRFLAAELWVEVRSIPWQRPHSVACRVSARLRQAVLTERNVPTRSNRLPRTVPLPTGWDARWEDPTTDGQEDQAAELTDILEWAVARDVISESDRELLVALVVTSATLGIEPRANGTGLASASLSRAVGMRLGLSERSVRRHTQRCLESLAAASTRFFADD